MADPITDFFEYIMNGKIGNIPIIYIILGIVFLGLIIYLIVTRKPKVKEFKPMDMKKETKRRFKRDYKYFGKGLHKYLFDNSDENKPIAYVIGYMKVVEMKAMKRYEPLYTKIPKGMLKDKHEKLAKEIYGISYSELNDVQKKNVDEVSKEEIRNQQIEVTTRSQTVKIVRGKKEIDFSTPVPLYAFKTCGIGISSKLLARIFGYGIDWMLFEKDQVLFEKKRIVLTAHFQRRTPFDIFVFSHAGKNLVEDITYQQERENIWQETANQIPRAVHFDTEASKSLLYRREDAKLEKEKRKAQTESREMR